MNMRAFIFGHPVYKMLHKRLHYSMMQLHCVAAGDWDKTLLDARECE